MGKQQMHKTLWLEEPKRRKHLMRSILRCEDNIKIDVTYVGREGLNRIEVAHDMR
jgi:hypothetical protein